MCYFHKKKMRFLDYIAYLHVIHIEKIKFRLYIIGLSHSLYKIFKLFLNFSTFISSLFKVSVRMLIYLPQYVEQQYVIKILT